MLRVKIEAIVGKGNIMFVCVAHDLRFVTKKTEMWKEARENAIQANRKVVLIESEKTEHPGTWKRNLKSREAHLQSAKKHRDACEAEEASKLRALDAAKEKIINSQAPPTEQLSFSNRKRSLYLSVTYKLTRILVSGIRDRHRRRNRSFGTTLPRRTINEVGKPCALSYRLDFVCVIFLGPSERHNCGRERPQN